MISYSKARSILKKAKIKIQDEEILINKSYNRIVSKDIFLLQIIQLQIMLHLMDLQLIQMTQILLTKKNPKSFK